MKIVCESCQAKYSIADEKIAGKVFKIRCKRCNEVILVRGDQEPAQEALSQESAGGPTDAIWHVVIDGEQRGPYAPDQIGEMLSKGQIDWEAYVWREGMDNWIAACDIPELVAAVMGPEHAQQQEAEAVPAGYGQTHESSSASRDARAVASNPLQANPPMGADPFADSGGGGSSGGLFGDPAAASEAGADLFRPSAEISPFSSGGHAGAFQGDDMAQVSSPRVGMDQAMTGARNENSVLFSLKNLQALATGSTSSTPISAPIAPSAGTGYASGEGSGLIDIRALATATGVAKDGFHEEDREALLSMGTKTGAFGALGSPIAAPAMGGDEEISKRKVLFAILGGSIFLGMCMIAVAIIMKPSTQPQPVATAVPVVPSVVNPPLVKPQTEEPAPTQLSEGEKAARAAAMAERTPSSGSDRDKSARSSGSSTKRKSGREEETPAKAAPAAPVKEESTAAAKEDPGAKKKKSSGSESIDDLLAGALSGSSKSAAKKSEAAAAAESGLPEKPTREDVMTALRAVQPAVSACGQGQGGVAMAAIVVGSSGRVQSVQVTQVPGPVASCVSRAVRGARFPKFSAPKFSVSFPFRL